MPDRTLWLLNNTYTKLVHTQMTMIATIPQEMYFLSIFFIQNSPQIDRYYDYYSIQWLLFHIIFIKSFYHTSMIPDFMKIKRSMNNYYIIFIIYDNII